MERGGGSPESGVASALAGLAQLGVNLMQSLAVRMPPPSALPPPSLPPVPLVQVGTLAFLASPLPASASSSPEHSARAGGTGAPGTSCSCDSPERPTSVPASPLSLASSADDIPAAELLASSAAMQVCPLRLPSPVLRAAAGDPNARLTRKGQDAEQHTRTLPGFHVSTHPFTVTGGTAVIWVFVLGSTTLGWDSPHSASSSSHVL